MPSASPSSSEPPGDAAAPFTPASSIYDALTREFNAGATRVILSSGQACVHYRIAMMSKDGDWIIAEEAEALDHVLAVLERHGARYRLGAPLSSRWLAGGWSSHFEYQERELRVRTDFVSRPARISAARRAALWKDAAGSSLPVVPIPDLIAIKRTLRDRDYAIIGGLALGLKRPEEVLRLSTAPIALEKAVREHAQLAAQLAAERPLLTALLQDPARIRQGLMEERLAWMEADRRRIATYSAALAPWAARWQRIAPELSRLPLRRAHERLMVEAAGMLPELVELVP